MKGQEWMCPRRLMEIGHGECCPVRSLRPLKITCASGFGCSTGSSGKSFPQNQILIRPFLVHQPVAYFFDLPCSRSSPYQPLPPDRLRLLLFLEFIVPPFIFWLKNNVRKSRATIRVPHTYTGCFSLSIFHLRKTYHSNFNGEKFRGDCLILQCDDCFQKAVQIFFCLVFSCM